MMVMACSGHQFSLCRQFTYRTIILPTLFWFPPTTWAAIALQTHLAYPPPIPWPCATTTTLPSLTLSRFFMVSPVKTGTLPTFFFSFKFFQPFCALGLHPPHLLHPPTLPGLQPHLRSLLCTSAHPLRTL